MALSENASRHKNIFAQQRLSFFEAPEIHKGVRAVVGCYKGVIMFLATELQTSRVYILPHAQGLFKPFELIIRTRNIVLLVENVVC